MLESKNKEIENLREMASTRLENKSEEQRKIDDLRQVVVTRYKMKLKNKEMHTGIRKRTTIIVGIQNETDHRNITRYCNAKNVKQVWYDEYNNT